MNSEFFGLHAPWPGELNDGFATVVVWPLGAQRRVPPEARLRPFPANVLFVLSFPDVNVHFLNVIVPVATPLSFAQVVPEAAPATGAVTTAATEIGTATAAIAAKTKMRRRIPFPFTRTF